MFNSKNREIVFISIFLLAMCVTISSRCLAFSDFYLAAKESTVLNVVTTINFEEICYRVDCIAVDEERNQIYAILVYDDYPDFIYGIAVIDCESNDVIEESPLNVSAGNDGMWINHQTNHLIIHGRDNVHIYDLGSYEELFSSSDYTTWSAHDISYNPATNLIYLGFGTPFKETYDRVEVIDGETYEHVSTIGIPESYDHPYMEHVMVAVNSEKNRVYATWTGDHSIFLVDGATHEIIKSHKLSTDYEKLQVNPYTNYVYLIHKFDTFTTVLDGETLEQVDSSNFEGDLMAIDSINNLLYTVKDDTLYVFNGTTHEILASLKLGTGNDINGIAVNSKTGKIYVEQRNSITVIQKSTEQIDTTSNGQQNNILFNILLSVAVIVLVFVGFWFAFIRKGFARAK